MNRLYRKKLADFRRICRQDGGAFFHEGKRIPCIFGSTDEDAALASQGGGELPVYDLVMTAAYQDFTTPPVRGDTIATEPDDEEYEVGYVNARPGSPLLKIHCENPDKP